MPSLRGATPQQPLGLHVLLLLPLLLAEVTGQAVFLPYWQLVKAHGARRYWELAQVINQDYPATGEFLATPEYFTQQLSPAAGVAGVERALMDYDCEEPRAMDFAGPAALARVDQLLPDWYMMPLNPGWTIDGWISYRGGDGALVSSWGQNSERWKIAFENDQLTLTWSEERMPLGLFKTCRMQQSLTDSYNVWHHFAVRYTASPPPGSANIDFFLDGVRMANDSLNQASDYCGRISQIVANHSIPMTLGATWANGTSSENFNGMMAKIALYHQPVTDQQLLMHAQRGFGFPPPCNRHGTCSRQGRCQCYPLWYGDRCDAAFAVASVTPNEGSYYGLTPITIEGAGFDAVNFSSVHVRIGPAVSHFDGWAGAAAPYGRCSLVSKSATQIVCVTQAWTGRGPLNVSVVQYEGAGVPSGRPVFSMCSGASIEDCYFTPQLLRTPRLWSFPQWAVPGALLTFRGEFFSYDDFTLLFAGVPASRECVLEGPTGDSQFSCRLPADISPGFYTIKLAMLPNGAAWPLPRNVYVHPTYITLYPLYPLEPRNAHCPTAGQTVQLLTPDVAGEINDTQIRVYDAPCMQRRTTDYHWLADKVNPDYWQTFGYDSCPPYLVAYSQPLYYPSAFTLYNTIRQGSDYVARKQRRFVDATGRSNCIMMEPDQG